MNRGYQVDSGSTDRARFARHTHAEAHAILALRDARNRLMLLRTVDEALDDLLADIARRSARLDMPPDAICDELERVRGEQLQAAARMATCGGHGT